MSSRQLDEERIFHVARGIPEPNTRASTSTRSAAVTKLSLRESTRC